MDSSVIPDPERFNGFRSYEKRQIPGQEHHHLWVQTDKQHLVFGHGKQACPGRHFAASEIKVVLARILTEFDMKNPQGEVRPKTYYLDEYIFPDPNATLLFRHRGESFLRGGAGGEL